MKFTKNKTTEENRRFWQHVEAVAAEVQNREEYFNYRTAAPLDENRPSAKKPSGDQSTGRGGDTQIDPASRQT